MSELTLEQIAENVRLWQWREKTGGVLQQRLPKNPEWRGCSPIACASYVTSRIYRKAPQPQVRWVNFYDEAYQYQWIPHDSEDIALGSRTERIVAKAVRVEFPPGTFPESDDE